MNSDGTIEEKRYDFPTGNSNYISNSAGAALRGQFYIFGGSQGTNSYKKIAKLTDCRFEELSITLPYSHSYHNAAVTLQDDSKVLLCFSSDLSAARCQVFDGTKAEIDAYSLAYKKNEGCIAHYNDNIIAVGDYSSYQEVVEVRDHATSSWTRTTDFPNTSYSRFQACLGVSDGTIVLGGYRETTSVYLFKMEKWSRIGDLQSNHYPGASAIQYNDEVYTVGQYKNEYFYYDNEELVDYIDIESSILYTNEQEQTYVITLDSKYDSCLA